ncbi:cupin domain-containing protein [Vibrio penaeicida]|uniref:cupin domain-containing protein n=1 Tax=Vibrio penaeicida TaxID=104609 RepID=UPI000CE9CCD3|nr:cupin domain-containing protein [Vibrio penaeicida]
MKPILLNQTLPEMMSVGSVENLGSTVISGSPQAEVAMISGAPEDAVSCGLFGCTEGEFSMQYPFTEHATVLEGEVELTNEETGESHTYKQGDSWFVEQGTKVRWHIRTPKFVKHYLAVAQ